MSGSRSRRRGSHLKRVAAGLLLAGAFGILGACHIPSAMRAPSGGRAYIVVDSNAFTVRYERPAYRAQIRYTYINKSGQTVSADYCKEPGPPALEKEVAPGQWVTAYSPVMLLCQAIPPFRLVTGASYRGQLAVFAVMNNTDNVWPTWRVDSVPGVYRLHWTLRAGPNPDDRTKPMIDAVSSSFRLTLPL
jgi:hypothetical protein